MNYFLIREDTVMKKIFYLVAFAAFAFTSCQQGLNTDKKPEETKVFTATTERPSTRTTLSQNGDYYDVLWQNEDQITIVDGVSNVGIYQTSSTTTHADFTYSSGTAVTTPNYKAWYPATVYNGGTPTIPATQTFIAGNISGSPMYAESSTESLAFKNICGIIKLNVSTSMTGKSVASISISANEGMSGAISNIATLATDGYTASVTGTSGVTLNCGAGVAISSTPTAFHFAVPANTYTGLTITVTTTDGLTQTRSANTGIIVGRSSITNISLAFDDLALDIDLTSSNDAVTIPTGVNARLTGHNYHRNITITGGNSIITLIDAEVYKLNINGNSTIVSKGTNTVNPVGDWENPIPVKEGVTVTFQGDGTLSAQSSYGAVLKCENNNASVIFKSGTYNFTAVSSCRSAIETGNLTIEGGTVNADCSGAYYNGIYAVGLVSISSGEVNARGSCHGIYVNGGDLTISGGTVTAEQTATSLSSPECTVSGISVHKDATGGTLTISGGNVTASAKRGPGIGTSWYRSGWSTTTWTKAIIISGGTVTVRTESEDQNAAIGFWGWGNKTQCDAITITEGITSLTLIQGPTDAVMFKRGDSECLLTVDSQNMSGYFAAPASVDWSILPNLQRTVTTTSAANDTWTFTPKP